MSEYQRKVFVPYNDDYGGGAERPAFTNREACEQHVKDLNAERGWANYLVEEWPLLDAAPVKVPIYRRGARVHVDGFVCAEEPGVAEQWDDEEPGGGLKPVEPANCGARVLVFARSEAEAQAAYERALGEARAPALAAGFVKVWACGRDCRHPAVVHA